MKDFILGIGTRRCVKKDRVKMAINIALEKVGISLDDLRLVSTIDLKRDEKGLIEACKDLGLPIVFIPKGDIKNLGISLSSSEVVRRHIGLDSVCEPCALLAGRRTRLVLRREIIDTVAVAIAKED